MKNKSRHANGLHWYHWVVVASSLVLTFIAWYISHTQVQEKIKQQFDFQSEQLLALILERMSRYEDALRSGVAAIHSQSHGVDAIEWRRFSQALNLEATYPGINGIGVIYYVEPENKDSFIAEERKLRPDFTIKPEHQNQEYWPITYVEPVEINKQAVGLDMAFETNRWTAAKLARDLGETQITGPIVLVQDEKKTPGFLQFVPFYKKQAPLNSLEDRQTNFLGHVYAPFIMSKLMAGTLEQKNRRLLFSLYDGEVELYNEFTQGASGVDAKPLFRKNVTIDIYGRQWQFQIETAKSFRDTVSTNQPIIILVAGIFIDGMLLAVFFMLSRAHRNAVELAEKMTVEHTVAKEYYQNVINSAPSGIAIINDSGRFEEVNQQMVKLFGYDEDQFRELTVEDLVPIKHRNVHSGYRTSFMKESGSKRMGIGREIFCVKKDQGQFPAEIGLAHFKVKGKSRVIASIVDLTDYILVANELKRSNKDLDDFAYVASHDLKAPLRGISQLTSWIQEDIYETASEETQENLDLLKSRTLRLERLLDDLLTYSRIGRMKGEIRTVDVYELVKQIFELEETSLELTLECDSSLPKFETLVTPLETVFRNLIGNAIKHHDRKGGVIKVTCEELNNTYCFRIIDDGPGIEPRHQQQIFEIFKTLKPRDEVEGSGMGLTIVKKTLESFNQSIRVISNGTLGTTFEFTWPKIIK